MKTELELPVAPISHAEIALAARALGATGGGSGTAQLLGLLCDENAQIDDVLRCLSTEPTLAARVLKVSNSPYYRSAGSVGTIARAVQLLGLSAIRGIAAAGCMDRIPMPALGPSLDAESFRRHSLAVAVAAQSLSKLTGAGCDGEAFMAGLLHDIGIVLMARLRPQAMAAAAGLRRDNAQAALQAETDFVGGQHTACGALLVEIWVLPAWLSEAIATHHTPAAPTGSLGTAQPAPTGPATAGTAALPALLALADGAARLAGFGLFPLCEAAPDPALALAFGLEPAALQALADGLPGTVNRLLPAA